MEGVRVSEFFYKESKSKTIFLFFFRDWGGGSGVRGGGLE